MNMRTRELLDKVELTPEELLELHEDLADALKDAADIQAKLLEEAVERGVL